VVCIIYTWLSNCLKSLKAYNFVKRCYKQTFPCIACGGNATFTTYKNKCALWVSGVKVQLYKKLHERLKSPLLPKIYVVLMWSNKSIERDCIFSSKKMERVWMFVKGCIYDGIPLTLKNQDARDWRLSFLVVIGTSYCLLFYGLMFLLSECSCWD